MDLYAPPPHLEAEWAALSNPEKADVYKWAREFCADALRGEARRLTQASEAMRNVYFSAADYLHS